MLKSRVNSTPVVGMPPSGRTKRFLPSDREGCLVQEFRDRGVNGNGSGHSRAALTNEVSAYLFEYLNGYRIPTHFLGKVSATGMLVRHLRMLPFRVVIWNVASGDYAKRFGLHGGMELRTPVIEHYWKAAGRETMVNEFHVYSLGLATPEQFRTVNRLTSRINIVLRSFLERRGLKLHSVALEFGIADGQMMVGDEISPRTCTFADLEKKKGLHGVARIEGIPDIDTYSEFRNRLFRAV